MSIMELDSKYQTLQELLAEIKELEEQAEAIRDSFKQKMLDEGTEELTGNGWRATWHNTQNARFDSKAFKAAHADLYEQFTKRTTGTRFTLNPVRA